MGGKKFKIAVWLDRILAQIAGLGNSYVNLLPFPIAYATPGPAPDTPQTPSRLRRSIP